MKLLVWERNKQHLAQVNNDACNLISVTASHVNHLFMQKFHRTRLLKSRKAQQSFAVFFSAMIQKHLRFDHNENSRISES